MKTTAALALQIAATVILASALPAHAAAFSLDDVAARARALSREGYRDHRNEVPKWMLAESMTYDQWRDIRFKPERALWKKEGLPFQVQFFHPGLYYDRTVAVNTVDARGVHPLRFDRSSFDYGRNGFASRVPEDIGYAGIRIHTPIKTAGYFDELIVFVGATYFRALGRDNVYGLSARGIAINTVEPGGEEFPHFVEFWLQTPEQTAASVVLYALMEGPSITGAYRFEVHPGLRTVVDVEARLFARKPIAKLGIAPLTSMFFFGENSRRRYDDFRPEVHDSDGLLAQFGNGEWLWRPLDNPPRVNASLLAARDPRGFGLIQRDRDFGNYQDLETHSELRPSAWVQPRGAWGEGRIELDEIPTPSELIDNIVAYWVGAKPLGAGERADFAYSVSFYGDDPELPPGGRVVATRQDGGPKGNTNRFVIDFAGKSLAGIPEDSPPQAVVTVSPESAAELVEQHLVRNPYCGGWRLSFQLKPASAEPVELRAFLENAGGVLTETWSYAIVGK